MSHQLYDPTCLKCRASERPCSEASASNPNPAVEQEEQDIAACSLCDEMGWTLEGPPYRMCKHPKEK